MYVQQDRCVYSSLCIYNDRRRDCSKPCVMIVLSAICTCLFTIFLNESVGFCLVDLFGPKVKVVKFSSNTVTPASEVSITNVRTFRVRQKVC